MMACERIGLADPALFFGLPAAAQDLWLEHVRNHLSGQYTPAPKKGKRQGEAKADSAILAAIQAQREAAA